MYNHNKAQQSKNRVHISWDILYTLHWGNTGDIKHAMKLVLIYNWHKKQQNFKSKCMKLQTNFKID